MAANDTAIIGTQKFKVTISANVLLVSVVILQANPARIGFSIYNNGANSTYITPGPTSSSASPWIIVATFANFNMFGPCVYTGQLSAIRNAGAGTIIITEFLE